MSTDGTEERGVEVDESGGMSVDDVPVVVMTDPVIVGEGEEGVRASGGEAMVEEVSADACEEGGRMGTGKETDMRGTTGKKKKISSKKKSSAKAKTTKSKSAASTAKQEKDEELAYPSPSALIAAAAAAATTLAAQRRSRQRRPTFHVAFGKKVTGKPTSQFPRRRRVPPSSAFPGSTTVSGYASSSSRQNPVPVLTLLRKGVRRRRSAPGTSVAGRCEGVWNPRGSAARGIRYTDARTEAAALDADAVPSAPLVEDTSTALAGMSGTKVHVRQSQPAPIDTSTDALLAIGLGLDEEEVRMQDGVWLTRAKWQEVLGNSGGGKALIEKHRFVQRVLEDKKECERRCALLVDALRESRESLRVERAARRETEAEAAREKGELEARVVSLEERAAHAARVLNETESVMSERQQQLMVEVERYKESEKKEAMERQRLGWVVNAQRAELAEMRAQCTALHMRLEAASGKTAAAIIKIEEGETKLAEKQAELDEHKKNDERLAAQLSQYQVDNRRLMELLSHSREWRRMFKDTGGVGESSYIPLNETLVKEGQLYHHYDSLDDRPVATADEGKFWIPKDVIRAVDAYAGVPVCRDKASPLLGVIVRLHNIYYKRHVRVVRDLHREFKTQTDRVARRNQNSKSYELVVSQDLVHDLRKQIKLLEKKLSHYERCEKFMNGLESLPRNWESTMALDYNYRKTPLKIEC